MKLLDNLAVRIVVFSALFFVIFLALNYVVYSLIMGEGFRFTPIGNIVLPIVLGISSSLRYKGGNKGDKPEGK